MNKETRETAIIFTLIGIAIGCLLPAKASINYLSAVIGFLSCLIIMSIAIIYQENKKKGKKRHKD